MGGFFSKVGTLKTIWTDIGLGALIIGLIIYLFWPDNFVSQGF